MKKALIAILVVVVLLVLYGWSAYNGLVSMRETATAQWQQVETQYQRRFDLVPNLVESVKGLMKQEQAVFSDVTAARARYAGAQSVNDKVAAASQMESALGRLLAIVENYPQIKSSEAVQNLMTQLEGTENRVSVERQRYNDDVRAYETAIKTFPRSVFASMFGFGDLTYFESQAGAENAPQVKF